MQQTLPEGGQICPEEPPGETSFIKEGKRGNRTKTAVVGAAMAAAMLAAALHPSSRPAARPPMPGDTPAAVTESWQPEPLLLEEPEEEKKKKRSPQARLFDKISRLYQNMPAFWQFFAMLPLLALGQLAAAAAKGSTAVLGGPVLGAAVGAAVEIAAAAGTLAVSYRLLHPDKRLRGLFCRRNCLLLFAAATALGLLDLLLCLRVPRWAETRPAVGGLALLAVFYLLWRSLVRGMPSKTGSRLGKRRQPLP